MGLFSRRAAASPAPTVRPKLLFASTRALEDALDGSDEQFATYFFALYRCSPDEPAGINERRAQLRKEYPGKSFEVGRHFVLVGEPAWLAVVGVLRALSLSETLSELDRAYQARRLEAVTAMHKRSQELPVPIDLSEGQLSEDPELDFMVCTALLHGQIIPGVA